MSNDLPANSILFSIGRLIWGDPYTLTDKDGQGNPLVIKSGPNKGQPRKEVRFCVAIPKTQAAWWNEPWGAKILAIGQAAFPNQFNQPSFSWKIKDGDDDTPNKNGNKPSDMEGARGHWLVWFSSSFLPDIVTADGKATLTQPGAVKCGYYVQVFGSVNSNGNAQNPGVFINASTIALAGYAPEISMRVDPTKVGFGGALPAGASAVPVGAMQPPGAMPGMPAAMPGAPGAVPTLPMTAAVPGTGMAPAVMPPTAVMPATNFLPPAAGVPAAPGAMPMPPAPARQMTPKANGIPYEHWTAKGWKDADLIAQGYMLP